MSRPVALFVSALAIALAACGNPTAPSSAASLSASKTHPLPPIHALCGGTLISGSGC
jgi:hypothetical protein